MKKIALTALLLSSSTAFATDTRVSSLQGNVGLADDTDYQRYGANAAGESAWLDYNGADLGASAGFGDKAVSFAQGEGRVDFGYYTADGDAGYRVLAGIASTEDINIGGAYGMGDMDFGAMIGYTADDTAISAHFRSRTLSDTDVTAYGATVGMADGSTDIGASYAMGWIWGADSSKAALTVGPGLNVAMPDGGDMEIGLTLAGANLAGEVTVKDWIGIRGSVAANLDAVDPTGDFDVATSMTTGFGASINTDSVTIDLMVSPDAVLGGPHFLTGVGSGPAASFSARFDI